jgi:hypothetical protein
MGVHLLWVLVQLLHATGLCLTSPGGINYTAESYTSGACRWELPNHGDDIVGLWIDQNTLTPADRLVLAVGRTLRVGVDTGDTPSILPLGRTGKVVLTVLVPYAEAVFPGAERVFSARPVTRGWCSGGACQNAGHCDGARCACPPDWTGFDCSLPIHPLPEGPPVPTGPVQPGASVYFRVAPARAGSFAISFAGDGDATPLLTVGHPGELPTHHPDSQQGSDREPWATLSSPDQVVRFHVEEGEVHYVRVTNHAWRSPGLASGMLRAGPGDAGCPFACHGHGACTASACTCDPGWAGVACRFPVATVGPSTTEHTLRPGQWSYVVADVGTAPGFLYVRGELLSGVGHFVLAADGEGRLPFTPAGTPPSVHSVEAAHTDPVGATHGQGLLQEFYVATPGPVGIGVVSLWGSQGQVERWSPSNITVRLVVQYAAEAGCRAGRGGRSCSGYPCRSGACDCPSGAAGPACSSPVLPLPATGSTSHVLGPGQYARHATPAGSLVSTRWQTALLRVGLQAGDSVAYPAPARAGGRWLSTAYPAAPGWELVVYNGAPAPATYTVDTRGAGALGRCPAQRMLDMCDGVGPSPLGVGVALAPGEWGYWLVPNGDPAQGVVVWCEGCGGADLFLVTGGLPGGPGLQPTGFVDRYRGEGEQRITLAPCGLRDTVCLPGYAAGGTVYRVGATGGLTVAGVRNGVNRSVVTVHRGAAGTTSLSGVCMRGFAGPACEYLCPGWAGLGRIHTLFAPAAPAMVCGGHGLCTGNGTCTCLQGWRGPACTLPATAGAAFTRRTHHITLAVSLGVLVCLCVCGWVRRKRSYALLATPS